MSEVNNVLKTNGLKITAQNTMKRKKILSVSYKKPNRKRYAANSRRITINKFKNTLVFEDIDD